VDRPHHYGPVEGLVNGSTKWLRRKHNYYSTDGLRSILDGNVGRVHGNTM
jgi:hypothetical protein